MKAFKEFINEEGEGGMPGTNASSGNVDGLVGEPPVSKENQRKYRTRNNIFNIFKRKPLEIEKKSL